MKSLKFGTLGLQAALLLAIASDLHATSYVPMRDEDLVDRTPLIAVAWVQEISAAPSERTATDYLLEVEEILKGSMDGRHLVLRVPGGVRPDGLGLKIWGAPTFRPEERVLVFLVPGSEGTWSLSQLMLGTFFEVPAAGGSLAVRDLAEAQAVSLRGKSLDPELAVRDFEDFRTWISARSEGGQGGADYWRVAPQQLSGLRARPEAFTLFEDGPTGFHLRWPEFDSGRAVTFFAHEAGQPGLPGGGFVEFQASLNAWNAAPGSSINYQYGGTTTASGGLTFPCDLPEPPTCTVDLLVNAIVFDDPNDNTVVFGGPFSCTAGGILAAGGPWFSSAITHTYQGNTYVTILSGDIVTNKNVGCFLSQNNAAAEVFAHELGHTLGIGHSCGDAASGSCNDDPPGDSDALMRAFAHNDGRGASVRQDDQAAVCFLYSGGTCSPFFADGFESGDLSAWSSSSP